MKIQISPLSRAALLATTIGLSTFAPQARAATVDARLVDTAHATLVSRDADATRRISVDIVLPSRDQTGLDAFVRAVSDPASSQYGHYLTPEAFEARFGAEPASWTAVTSWARTQGLTLGKRARNHTIVSVSGTAAQLERAFATKLSTFATPQGRSFYAATVKPSMPDAIASHVVGIVGLSDQSGFRPMIRLGRVLGETVPAPRETAPDLSSALATTGSGPQGSYVASDLRKAYVMPAMSSSAPAQTVAVFEQGGFVQKDITTYLKYNKLSTTTPVTVREVNGYNGAVNNEDVEAEAVLDVDMIIALNPAVAGVLVYEDGNDSFQTALLDALSDMASDNKAKTVSISYGEDEDLQGNAAIKAESAVLQQLASEGITVLASSGDSGAAGNAGTGLHVSDPATQPYITAVGGTRLITNAKTQAWARETVWNDLAAGYGGTGGGVSSVWSIPSWQAQVGASHLTSVGGSSKMRNVPDIAAVADPEYGVLIYTAANGGYIMIGGTSVAAPVWGGVLSVVNGDRQAAGATTLGYFNPTLYSHEISANRLHDVVSGNNGHYAAAAGFDDATGWGTPRGSSVVSVYK